MRRRAVDTAPRRHTWAGLEDRTRMTTASSTSTAPAADGTAYARGSHLNLILLGAVILLWGAHWPVMKVGLGHTTPLWYTALRFVSASATMFAAVAVLGRLRLPPRHDWPVVLSVGVLQMLVFGLMIMFALRHVPAGRSAVLAYTTSLWVVPLAVLLLGERVSRLKAMGTVLGLAGILVLFNPLTLDWGDRGVVVGNLLLVGAAVIWALCIIHIRGHRWRASALELAPWQMLLAAVPLIPAALLVEGPVPGDGTWTFFAIMAYSGPVATGFCFWAIIAVNTRLPASTLATAMLAIPVTGIAASALTLGEALTPSVLIGMATILGGMALVVWADRTARRG